ncbi:uncharacterized protein LOC113359683 [Papaver somniferum]|uniref:uncharacterized protein LOC113359683 n=1 Tax=Papaver somniferum TaxID=3469 RepID=UPI000E6F5183|nr:uncharacterized protein LOC113359683 [Papaver somniferum]
MKFMKAIRDIIIEDLMDVVKEFENLGNLFWIFSCTRNITLIPKCEGVVNIHNLRPIRPISGIYTIISKMLAYMLKKVSPLIITDFQGAFVEERQITGAILIVSELIDSSERDKNPNMVCKVVLEKAFDNISWGYIDNTLVKFVFEYRWI